MGPVEMALLMELVVVPVIRKLAQRRGLYGVNAETLKNVKGADVVKLLQTDAKLHQDVLTGVADAVDNIAGDAIDPMVEVLKVLLGVKRSDVS